MVRARSTMRAKRLVNTFRITPIAEMRKMGVNATCIRWAISTPRFMREDRTHAPANGKRPGRCQAEGALHRGVYLVDAGGVAAFLCFLLGLCDFVAAGFDGVVLSAAAGVAVFGGSAAIEAAAKPKVNNAVVISVAGLFIRSPSGGNCKRREEYARFARFQLKMKIISHSNLRLKPAAIHANGCDSYWRAPWSAPRFTLTAGYFLTAAIHPAFSSIEHAR